MILGDKNRNLLISTEYVTICRESSLIKYNNQFQKEYTHTILHLPRSFKDKSYDFSNNKITSLATQEQKQFAVGSIVDYTKQETQFFFIKKSKNTTILVNKENKRLLEFKSLYFFMNNCIYYIEQLHITKMDLITLEKSKVITIAKEPTVFCVGECLKKLEIIGFADSSNKIYIYNGESYKMYHWMCKTILMLTINDEYVVAASKSGDVAQFHIKLQKIEPLFKFQGEFLDLKIRNTNIYVLTDIQFIVFDLLTNSISYSEYLVPLTDFHFSNIKNFVNLEETDIFNIKRKTKVEVLNLIEHNNSVSTAIIAYTKGAYVFVYDCKEQTAISAYRLETDINLISGSLIISLSQRKSSYIVKIYDFYSDKLVLKSVIDINTRSKIPFKKMYYLRNRLYIQTDVEIYLLSKLNILESVYKLKPDSVVKKSENSLYVLDEKGIYNICTGKYEIKQKGIKQYSFYKESIIFYIENKGIYLDLPDRTQVLEIKNILDIKMKNEVLLVLYHHSTGKIRLGQYKAKEEAVDSDPFVFELIIEEAVDSASNTIIDDNVFMSKANTLLI